MFVIMSTVILVGVAVILLKTETMPKEQQDTIIRGVWSATLLFGTVALLGMVTWK